VIIKFKSADDKFKLFGYITQLREDGIRISNDLSYLQRQKLRELSLQGLGGYFKGGNLVTFPKPVNTNGANGRRRFPRVNRRVNPNEQTNNVSGSNGNTSSVHQETENV